MNRGRSSGFFRGGELRGLIVFAVVMAVGWPVILNYARPRAEPEAPRVVDPRPLEPDTGIAFQGVSDKEPMGVRENAAYAILLKRARETSAEALGRDSRSDVFYAQLCGRPDLYRGVAVHLEGTLVKALFHEKMNPELVPKGRIAELWFNTPESHSNPYAVMVEDLPPGLAPGYDLHDRVIVDGYFFKLLAYTAGDARRFAPLLIGRLRWADADPKTGAVAGPPKEGRSWTSTVAVVVAAVVVYVGLRLAYQVRRFLPGSSRTIQTADPARRHAEEIDPEALATFLASAAEVESETEPGSGEHDAERPR